MPSRRRRPDITSDVIAGLENQNYNMKQAASLLGVILSLATCLFNKVLGGM